MKKTFHAFISGRVQGVCFRIYTQQQAHILGLTGWVKNLPDGRVEIMASGEAEQLKTLQDWLQKGPEMAKVLNVEIKIIETKEYDGFSTQ